MSVNLFLRRLIDVAEERPKTYKKYAMLSRCTYCRRTLLCQKEEMTGCNIDVDAEPVNQLGEMIAIERRIATYQLYGYSKMMLERRMSWDILACPAGYVLPSGMEIIVCVQHDCRLMLGWEHCLDGRDAAIR